MLFKPFKDIIKNQGDYDAEYKSKFKELRLCFQNHPLDEDELGKYYVSFSGGNLKEFKANLDIMDHPGKFLFTGQKGVGKSTELNQLAKELKGNYFVLKMSIAELMDPHDPDYRDILLLMAIKLLVEFINYESVNQYVRLINQLLKIAEVKDDALPKDKVDKKMVLVRTHYLLSKMRIEPVTRKANREKLANDLFSITCLIDTASKEIEIATGKKPFLIVDDLDKIDLDYGITKDKEVDKSLLIFHENVRNLILPQCHVMYTMPFSLYHRDEFILFRHEFDDFMILSPVNIYTKEEKEEDGKKKYIIKENKKQIEIFEKILINRLKSVTFKKKPLTPKDVFDEEVMVDLIIRTGGLVSNLIKLMHDCCFALSQKAKKLIDSGTVSSQTEKWQRETSRLLHSKERSILRKVYDAKTYKVVPDELLPLFLRETLIIEQCEGEIWYDIHPLLRKILGLDEEPDHIYK